MTSMVETFNANGHHPVYDLTIDWGQADARFKWWCWDFHQQCFYMYEPEFVYGEWRVTRGGYLHVSFTQPPLGCDVRLLKRIRPLKYETA